MNRWIPEFLEGRKYVIATSSDEARIFIQWAQNIARLKVIWWGFMGTAPQPFFR